MAKNNPRAVSLLIVLLAVLVLGLAAAAVQIGRPDDTGSTTTTTSSTTSLQLTEETGDETTPALTTESTTQDLSASLTLAASGEVLMHDHVLAGGLTPDGYDYDYAFEYIRPEIGRADYAICDMEGTLAGEPYRGWPLFSAPDAVADALAYAGFDGAIVANNHILDRGPEGMDRTIRVLQGAGLDTIGVKPDEDTPSWILRDLNGIKVGLSAWTWETIRQGDNLEIKGLNGLAMPEEAAARIDSFSLQESPDFLSEDVRKVAVRVGEMREAGAEVVVFLMHWGVEYSTSEDRYAQIYTQALADAGCDIVFGAGPHVIQPVREIRSTAGDHSMLCFYSVGNQISDQYFNTGDSAGHAEDGLIAVVSLERGWAGDISLTNAGYLATYCSKRRDSETTSRNTIIPIEAALTDPEAHGVSDRVELLEQSLARTRSIMAENTGSLEVRPLVHLPESPEAWPED